MAKHKLIGTQITHLVTGLRVEATITGAQENRYAITLFTEHEPVNWGGDIYTKGSVSIRKCDNWIIGGPQLNGVDMTRNDFNF